jgi:hypothetical protein
MTERDSVDPTLSDILKTALANSPHPESEPIRPSVVVHGHNNILSWGGDVHIADFHQPPLRQQP